MSTTTTVKKLYLAPANHYNAYCIAGYNEKDAVRTACKGLCRKGCPPTTAQRSITPPYTPTAATTRAAPRRPPRWAPTITSRSTTTPIRDGTAAHRPSTTPDSTRSKALAAAIAEKLNAVCTVPVTFPNPVRSGMDAFDGAGYGEIREPYRRGVIPVLVEVNFHDYEPAARYLIDHQDEQADAIVQAIAETLGLEEAGAEEAAQKHYKAGDIVMPVRNVTAENGKKQGRLFGGGRWTIYEDRYTVKQDSRADGRTVLAGENGDTVAAVYADDLALIGAGGTVPAPTPEPTPDAKPFPDVPASVWYTEAVNGSPRGVSSTAIPTAASSRSRPPPAPRSP